MKLEQLVGKTVESVVRYTHGHYDYVGYRVTFTDGTQVRFEGTSFADVEAYLQEPSPSGGVTGRSRRD